MPDEKRTPILYLAPWVDFGGTDKGTIDWFKWLDRERFAPSLITTQPSLNRRLAEVVPYADEVWPATEFFAGEDLPKIIFDFIQTREVEVLHIMNSRLGFDLLPDLAALPRRPEVVVQLHVEEQDKSGYVRYVTTRYGNLVDAFSVTSQHLADAVERYDVPRSKCHVIYTGVDAEEEFAPARVKPIDGLDPDAVQLLYPGRLVEQKDPLLMVRVAAALRDRGLRFQVQVVGEGPLEHEVRRAVSERGLDDVVRFHPPTDEIARWFAACDLLLMTSVFEGVPYVVYEAMAMAAPVVAPALPGNAELMDERCGVLVSPRGHVDGYVSALADFVEDADKRRAAGEHARARVRERFSLEQMGREHSRLYRELLEGRNTQHVGGASSGDQNGVPAKPIRLRSRPSSEKPLVSVIVPCFNHGRYLAGCIDTIRAQTYPNVEVFVVDDASTDPHTIALIEQLAEQADDVTVIRMPRNGGPSAARNAAIERAEGRYVFPVDADNLLLPEAIDRLVDQLQSAGEEIGFIYPNLQYFGNRNDYFQAPDYNLYVLLQSNFADTSSLLDREVFSAGLRYPDDIVVGHEDWDFVLSLAERGVYGAPAAAKTLLYRKVGFSRSDVVEYGRELFHDRMSERHPALYARSADIKARWAPAVTIIPLTPLATDEEQEQLATLASRQKFRDFEVVARAPQPWRDNTEAPHLRRIPPELARSRAEALEIGWRSARGAVVLVDAGNGLDLLEDPAHVAKLVRTISYNRNLSGIAFTDAGEAARVRLQLLRPEDQVRLDPHALLWRADREDSLGDDVQIVDGDELGSLTAAVAAQMPIQWRHAPRPAALPEARAGGERTLRVPRPTRGSAIAERRLVRETAPKIPKQDAKAVRRWKLSPTWMPPETQLICRHVSDDGTERVVTNDREPPPGFKLEYDVGMVRRFSAAGTSRLVALLGGGYAAPDADDAPPPGRSLGFVEQAPFPLLDALIVGIHRPTGNHVLIAGEEDPIGSEVEPLLTLGFVESYPVNPRHRPNAQLPFRVRGLVRAVDRASRRHVYAIGGLPRGETVGELGALIIHPGSDGIPVWLTPDGFLVTSEYGPVRAAPDPVRVARWVAAPVSWGRSVAPPAALVRASVRRALDFSPTHNRGVGGSARPSGAPDGYLARAPRPSRVPLYSSVHPVNGDQLLTNSPLEASDMGYINITRLGYLVDTAPVTGSRALKRVSVPWASRFGHNARTT